MPTTDVPVHILPGAARSLCRAIRGSVSPLLQALFGVPAEQARCALLACSQLVQCKRALMAVPVSCGVSLPRPL